MPGRCSTPELTSTTSGRTRATASPTVSGTRPPASTILEARQARAGLASHGEVQRNARSARCVRNPRLHQHGVGVPGGLAQRVEIGRRGDPHHPPDEQPLGPETDGILPSIRAVELSAGEPSPAADPQDLLDGLGAVHPEDRDPVGGLADGGRTLDGDDPWPTSKNDAQVGRPGARRHRRIAGAREPADLDLRAALSAHGE